MLNNIFFTEWKYQRS